MTIFQPKETRGVVHLCSHCSTSCVGKYCEQCKTAKGRQEMDDNNRKHFEKMGLPEYKCKVCDKEK